MNCEIANVSRVGARPYNEDRLGYSSTGEALFLALADGLGGHANGALAAELAVTYLVDAFRRAAQPRLPDPDVFLFRAIGKAHAVLCAYARERGLEETPRTTIVACVVQDGRAWWLHVGDSRLYLLREGRVVARTEDQTLVQELLATGRISAQEAEWHPQRNVLLQCLGGPVVPRLEPASSVRLRRGDVLLLCSDGFYGPLSANEIAGGLPPDGMQAGLEALSTQAEARAGAHCDNLSVVAAAWNEDDGHRDPAALPEYMRLSDADVEREVERLKQAFRARRAGAAREYLSDEEIACEIEKIRRAFQLQRAALAGTPGV